MAGIAWTGTGHTIVKMEMHMDLHIVASAKVQGEAGARGGPGCLLRGAGKTPNRVSAGIEAPMNGLLV